MICKVLHQLYGRDTRSAQVVNVVVNLVWALLILLHIHGVIAVDLPHIIETNVETILSLMVGSSLIGVWGIVAKDKQKQVFKVFSLLLGSLTQAILANSLFSNYPPLEMMLLVCTGLSLWLFFAVFYIVRCEGLNGEHTVP